MGGEAKRQLPSGGVAHHDDPLGIKLIVACDLGKKTATTYNILERSGPAAARIANTAIFNIPGGTPFPCKCRTQMAGVKQVVLNPPVSAVDVHHHGKSSFLSLCRKPEV